MSAIAGDLEAALDQLAAEFRHLKGIGTDAGELSDEILFNEWDWEVGVGLYGEFRKAEAARAMPLPSSASAVGTTVR